ncbi:protein of unknown function [Cupriavidus taiwanensis]|nr:protein of unknown function [Cupriavidus taiwanensis]
MEAETLRRVSTTRGPSLPPLHAFGHGSCHALSFHRMIFFEKSFYRMIITPAAKAGIILKNEFSHGLMPCH